MLLKDRRTKWQEDGSSRVPTNKEVLDYWHLAPVPYALAVRRLRWAQRMAKNPEHRRQPAMAYIGASRIEQELGVKRVAEDGWPTASSTPWLQRLRTGLELLRGLDAGDELWAVLAQDGMGLAGALPAH